MLAIMQTFIAPESRNMHDVSQIRAFSGKSGAKMEGTVKTLRNVERPLMRQNDERVDRF